MGKSEVLIRLFEFLLERTLENRPPKEIDIAFDVFGKGADFDVAADAVVRVHIHRLRRKLEEANEGIEGDRLTIPRGEYRLAIEAPDAVQDPFPSPEIELLDSEPEPPLPTSAALNPPPASPRWFRLGLIGAVCAALAIGVAIGAIIWSPRGDAEDRVDAVADTAFWRPLAQEKRQTLIVTGDYYMFGEKSEKLRVSRLIREFSINSREDLDEYIMTHPGDRGRYINLNLHYLPLSTGYAIRDVLPIASGLAARNADAPPRLIPMSRVSAKMLKDSPIVYIGYLGALGLLYDPLFEASGFTMSENYDELIDRKTGAHYMSDWSEKAGKGRPRKDFAYLASFQGPSGNPIIIISGTQEAAITQAATIVTDKARLDAIAARAGTTSSFEALYEVRTMGSLDLDSTLLVARPLNLTDVWRPGARPRPLVSN